MTITYNERNSGSFGLILTDVEKPAPKKQIVREKIPFSNRQPDFSRVLGKYTYQRRTLKYTFACKAPSEKLLTDLISDVSEWLSEAPAGDLKESSDPSYRYAECTCDEIGVSYISPRAAKIEAVFTCYPYKISEYTHPAYYAASASFAAETYVSSIGKDTVPLFTCAASCQISYNDIIYTIPANSRRHMITDIVFRRGGNEFRLRGSGELMIECLEEVF